MFFVYYIVEGCIYEPEIEAFEYIDENFPWLDDYKPESNEITLSWQFIQPWLEETVYLDILPPCGWIGLCADLNCLFDDHIGGVQRNFTYDANNR